MRDRLGLKYSDVSVQFALLKKLHSGGCVIGRLYHRIKRNIGGILCRSHGLCDGLSELAPVVTAPVGCLFRTGLKEASVCQNVYHFDALEIFRLRDTP
ncbi:hypothetical protein TcasGA2_TC014450 [Tribolium castaneum]|uniref:Uncharacterized protein n=1 Tax=Tribolium castaneum TaxID=7070 RepID=D6WM09_TRICA|nr:hypothetical protein TcasGA2_TC014450 [Tribolium castaneum]